MEMLFLSGHLFYNLLLCTGPGNVEVLTDSFKNHIDVMVSHSEVQISDIDSL